jgi:hypothetical protein
MPVVHPYNRTRVRINTPLDFLVVSDHAEFFGGIRDIYNDGIQDPDPGLIERLVYWYRENEIRDAIDAGDGPAYFANLLPVSADPIEAARAWTETASVGAVPGADVSATNAWQRARDIAEHHYRPGEFTTLLGWEWSSMPGGANLHRVVITDADGSTAGEFMPFSSTTSPFPQDLWTWLDETANHTGANFIAIPHNSNISKGTMFANVTLHGEPISADLARIRATWEPVAEITQIKGDSETHPDLSPNDEFADFETYPFYIQNDRAGPAYVAAKGDYIRSALGEGLRLHSDLGANPFQFGVIGSTDSHTGLSSAEEPNFWGKMAYDSVPENKPRPALAIGPTGWSMQAGGLAAVWAEENTREAIVAAFKRREVYATTGPRIRLTFSAISDGVATPMGGIVSGPRQQSPRFDVTAQKDPNSANLDRIQIIKGWLDENGSTHEQIYNVAWSDERSLDTSGQLPPVGDTVDRDKGTWQDTIGAGELSAQWSDPSFQSDKSAFYYVRVLQIPTPRHALLDAIALGMDEPTEGPSIITERAYSSSIWYEP